MTLRLSEEHHARTNRLCSQLRTHLCSWMGAASNTRSSYVCAHREQNAGARRDARRLTFDSGRAWLLSRWVEARKQTSA